ncbi:short-chain dehydrogenase [Mycobacterium adipatum]|uniref:Short-chain dehydrogenase n=1 Tax=Mycobacterium adipatum TaxID=1682113 RepID=A0A172UVA1_9MYCO|nr:SDR family oxidoreductase [Mycobacterium adipatum]ANE82976.1 short-chain dehydrogenase [Mycobacterium adipatum]MBI5735660.1 SDR family oxidoreductase [Mycolicibacterium neoaurum]
MVAVRGKTVLVTGGRRGLGSALVDEMLARGAVKVYSTARESYSDNRERVISLPLEVRDEQSVAALADSASDVDIVINNAGVLLPGSLLTGDFDEIIATFDINAFGPLRVTRALAPILAGNGGGALVNVHSVLSWLGGSGAYGASKAAIWSLTNSLRAELSAQGTQVLGVHAGFIDTDMVSAIGLPKTAPAEVAARVIDALEAGAHEVLVDDITAAVKAKLSGPVEDLVFDLAH